MKKVLPMIGAGILGVSLLGLTPAMADNHMQNGANNSNATMMQGKAKANMMKAKMKNMKEKLGLTDEQMAKIKQIRESSKGEMMPLRQAMRENRSEMRQLVQSKDYSSDKAQALIEKNRANVEKYKLMKANKMNQIWQVLTPEQQMTWQKVQAKYHGKRHM